MKRQDLTGLKFHRLTVIEYAGATRPPKRALWKCKCDCGSICEVIATHLRNGNTKSCGCLRNEVAGGRTRTHGLSKTREYETWCHMIQRCEDPRQPGYKHWGGRGITICDRWRNDFEAFLADMGHRPSAKHSLDRINNDGNYEPSNCRWATRHEQARNQRH